MTLTPGTNETAIENSSPEESGRSAAKDKFRRYARVCSGEEIDFSCVIVVGNPFHDALHASFLEELGVGAEELPLDEASFTIGPEQTPLQCTVVHGENGLPHTLIYTASNSTVGI